MWNVRVVDEESRKGVVLENLQLKAEFVLWEIHHADIIGTSSDYSYVERSERIAAYFASKSLEFKDWCDRASVMHHALNKLDDEKTLKRALPMSYVLRTAAECIDVEIGPQKASHMIWELRTNIFSKVRNNCTLLPSEIDDRIKDMLSLFQSYHGRFGDITENLNQILNLLDDSNPCATTEKLVSEWVTNTLCELRMLLLFEAHLQEDQGD